MKISIIIPVYNVEKYIHRCLTSIIKQTMTEEVECIIVNDATPDKSIDIIQELLSDYRGNISFHIINHKKNEGLAAARNSGMKHAKGDYVIHIDSDDFCETTMLEEMYNKAEEFHTDITMCDLKKVGVESEYTVSQPIREGYYNRSMIEIILFMFNKKYPRPKKKYSRQT